MSPYVDKASIENQKIGKDFFPKKVKLLVLKKQNEVTV